MILVDIVAVGWIGFAVCRDGLLPPAVGRVHPRWRTSYRFTALAAVVIALFAAFVPLATLVEMVSIGTLFAFFVVSIAVAVLRRTKPGMPRPFRTPQVPLLPVVSALLCLALMTSLARRDLAALPGLARRRPGDLPGLRPAARRAGGPLARGGGPGRRLTAGPGRAAAAARGSRPPRLQ